MLKSRDCSLATPPVLGHVDPQVSRDEGERQTFSGENHDLEVHCTEGLNLLPIYRVREAEVAENNEQLL
jgi:hypothetical protein